MKSTFIVLFVQSFLIWREIQGLEPSSILSLCNPKDPKLSECVKESGQKFITTLGDGISEWNVPPIDPMTTPSIVFKSLDNGNNLIMEYKNVVQTGFSKVIIEDANVDLAHGVMTFKLKYPFITFAADYNTNGQFFGFDLHGNGKANISVWNAYSSFVLKFHVEADHIKQESAIFGFSFDKIYLDYTNLIVNDDEELSKSASTFLNSNSNAIIDGFKPQLENFYSDFIGECLKGFFENVPYSVLFKSK